MEKLKKKLKIVCIKRESPTSNRLRIYLLKRSTDFTIILRT